MKRKNLGLPSEYKKEPQYFDAWNINETTEFKNSVIEKILKQYHVKTVLDMTCGTGSQVFFLIKHGYQVTGSDFSPELLKIARKKASDQNIDVTFIDGDMRTLKVGQFDAVITIFNAIGHVTKTGFEKTVKNIYKNLKSGGIYVFDIFNLNALPDGPVDFFTLDKTKIVNDAKIHNIQHSTLDKKHGLLTSINNDTIQIGSGKPKKSQNKFTLQIYTVTELTDMLEKTGFEVLKFYDMDGSKFIENKSISILMVAQKK